MGWVGGLTAGDLGEPLCSHLSGSWGRPASTKKLGVGRCKKAGMMGQRGVWGGVVRTRPGFGELHRHTPIAPPLPPPAGASVKPAFHRGGCGWGLRSHGQHCGSGVTWNWGLPPPAQSTVQGIIGPILGAVGPLGAWLGGEDSRVAQAAGPRSGESEEQSGPRQF